MRWGITGHDLFRVRLGQAQGQLGLIGFRAVGLNTDHSYNILPGIYFLCNIIVPKWDFFFATDLTGSSSIYDLLGRLILAIKMTNGHQNESTITD